MSRRHFEAVAEIIKDRLERAEADRDKATTSMRRLADEDDERSADFEERLAEIAGARVNEVTDLADNLCELFYKDNPRFDRAMFIIACGMEA